MKNKVYILVVLLLSFLQVKAQDTGMSIMTNYHPTGQIKSFGVFNDTVKNGLFIELDRNGRLLKQEEYLFGKLHGKYIEYQYGRIKLLKNYSNGVLDGVVENYHSNRKLSSLENYSKGKKDGESIWYYSSGKVFAIYNYVDGKIEGKVDLFYENGKVKSSYHFKNNEMEGDYFQYSQNGVKLVEGQYKNDKKSGKWRYYNESAKLLEERKYRKGKLL